MGRNRDSQRRDWPTGLYERRRGQRTYYMFRLPGTRREVSLGSDLEAAKQAIEIYSSRNRVDPVARALNRIDPPAITLQEHFDWFAETELSDWLTRQGRPRDANTLSQYRGLLNRAAKRLGANRAVPEISYDAIKELLDSYSSRTSNRYWALLAAVFRCAVTRGLRSDNPVDAVNARRHTN